MRATLLWVAALAPALACASPFVNETPDPELAQLRPLAPQAVEAPSVADLPRLALTFVPKRIEPKSLPVPVAAPSFNDLWERMRAGFALPELPPAQVREAEQRYAARPQVVARIFERSRFYLFHIVDELEKRHMPTELALLPFVESGFDPFALSSAQALGLWQFIPPTARKYNLPRSDVYDARRHAVASTTAALDYLQFLYGIFNDWHLALAAYNCGEDRVAAAIERNKARGLPTDYSSLTLPAETRQYVPRLEAVKRMVTGQALLKVELPKLPNRPYFAAVSKPLPKSPGVDLALAARFAETSLDEFRELNAAHSESLLNATATLPLLVPADRAETFVERLERYLDEQQRPRTRRAAPSKRM